MPKLGKNDLHKCLFCDYSSPRRTMKIHLASAGKKGLRCPGLRAVIPKDVWTDAFLPYYTANAKMPDLSAFVKKSRGPKKKAYWRYWTQV